MPFAIRLDDKPSFSNAHRVPFSHLYNVFVSVLCSTSTMRYHSLKRVQIFIASHIFYVETILTG